MKIEILICFNTSISKNMSIYIYQYIYIYTYRYTAYVYSYCNFDISNPSSEWIPEISQSTDEIWFQKATKLGFSKSNLKKRKSFDFLNKSGKGSSKNLRFFSKIWWILMIAVPKTTDRINGSLDYKPKQYILKDKSPNIANSLTPQKWVPNFMIPTNIYRIH